MKEEFYFTLYCGPFIANTYIGSRSNAKAYFNRWVRKHFPYYEEYEFTVYRYGTLQDMLNSENLISSYALVIVE